MQSHSFAGRNAQADPQSPHTSAQPTVFRQRTSPRNRDYVTTWPGQDLGGNRIKAASAPANREHTTHDNIRLGDLQRSSRSPLFKTLELGLGAYELPDPTQNTHSPLRQPRAALQNVTVNQRISNPGFFKMKYLSLPAFDLVTSALNFDTPDCHVTGSCDLYTTKAAGSDKKLYKNIQQSLESQHAALVKFGASLSLPQRDSMAASLNFSRSSPFGSLDEVSNRRTFAYLIATLNASHPDYDFSQILRPADFKRERVLKRVMTQIDSTLSSVRPNTSFLDPGFAAVPNGCPPPAGSGRKQSEDFNTGVSPAPAWGPHMWAAIDKEMRLKDCTVFSYQPADDPFDEEEGAIWALHYFFFNKALKRVCYIYVRGVPVMSHSPRVPAHMAMAGRTRSSFSAVMEDDDAEDAFGGANKRARYWLGDRFAERLTMGSDDEMDDGLIWNRDADGDVVTCPWVVDDDVEEEDEEEYEMVEEEEAVMDSEEDEDEMEKVDRKGKGRRRSSTSEVRGVSEDIAARMEIDV
ncbi:hypothetical protein VTJ49DRAFT_6042 [Mycothermus thermophilus]|uniref:Repressor of RNA polymerase III transcription MAF1 n=1 Tax=Humicola insolens TaxID=85995 RepID=A0ABR3V1Z5_HUMIN